MTRLSLIAVMATLFGSGVSAGTVDLTSWAVEGGGNWVVEGAANDAVRQTLNTEPGVVFASGDAQGTALSGEIRVNTTDDNDFIGFVLGYNAGDLTGANADIDYLLVDWKQGTQAGWDAGLSISRVTGGIHPLTVTTTASDPWLHQGPVNFLTRSNAAGANYATTGWADLTSYVFDIIFTADRVVVSVNGQVEIDILAADYGGAFSNGGFGFYNFSQRDVTYQGVTLRTVPTDPGGPGDPAAIPLPAAGWLLIAALGGMGAMARRRT